MPVSIAGDGTITGFDAGASGFGRLVAVTTATTNNAFSTSASGVPSTITNGVEILSLSYTPAAATNKLIVITNTVSLYETSNIGERCWLALWDGSTFIGANSGTAPGTNFGSSLNVAYTSINYEYTAGSTSTRTISVRAGGDTTVTINTNAYTGTDERLISMTVVEVAA